MLMMHVSSNRSKYSMSTYNWDENLKVPVTNQHGVPVVLNSEIMKLY